MLVPESSNLKHSGTNMYQTRVSNALVRFSIKIFLNEKVFIETRTRASLLNTLVPAGIGVDFTALSTILKLGESFQAMKGKLSL
ncbi:hypothetical protein TVAG_514430 [Trichomonas vaginalis G3]|uniref:Uncharacterized protein n=1 Tax=Trichomonas vaginalis (strain ATCC PRA-98 / G3) TaxID=412133 RepID=A2HDF9_TRIV3|nr:hypothetical protein TVAG_514430 [Trichomonas vaginalis G3]|eukprot:XP_001285488.1 hypothetical protein [Trichomonas vaginalis G3]